MKTVEALRGLSTLLGNPSSGRPGRTTTSRIPRANRACFITISREGMDIWMTCNGVYFHRLLASSDFASAVTQMSHEPGERPRGAEVGVAEGAQVVPEAMRQRQQQ